MSTRDNGGPAFPQSSWVWESAADAVEEASADDRVRALAGEKLGERLGGMTLRDYFAAKAMAAMIINPGDWGNAGNDERARFAYYQADAMLKARTE